MVLSSGGARGIAHIGVIEELEKAGYRISSIAGTSMGSVVGGMYSLGKMNEYRDWLLNMSKIDIIKFLDLTLGHGGLVKGEKIVQVMAGFIGDALIEDLPIPYTAVAVDLTRHKEIWFSEGSLMKAIRASISIPTVFLPVTQNHSCLVDGGVLNPLPLDAVARKPGDLLVSVNVNSPSSDGYIIPESGNPKHESGYKTARENLNRRWSELVNRGRKTAKPKEMGLFDLVSESINLMQHRLTMYSIENHQPDIVINLPYRIANVFDFYKAETLVENGRTACKNALELYESKVEKEESVVGKQD